MTCQISFLYLTSKIEVDIGNQLWEKFYDNNICKQLHVSTGDDQDKTDRFKNNLLSTNDEQISM